MSRPRTSPMPPAHTPGGKLLKVRKWSGLSQQQFSHLAGVPHSTYSTWEIRPNRTPDPIAIRKIAEHFSLPITWFWDEKESDVPTPAPTESEAVILTGDEADRVKRGFAITAAIRTWHGILAGSEGDEELVAEDLPTELPTFLLVGETRNLDLHDLLKISGASLSPRVPPGSQLLCYRNTTRYQRSIVLATNPEGKTYAKVLRLMNDRWELWSIGEGSKFTDLTGWTLHGYTIAILTQSEWGSMLIEHNDGRPIFVSDAMFV